MRAWWALYKKEINTIGFFTMVVFLMVLAWELFLFYKINAWTMGLSFGLSFLPFSFFPVLILWLGYNSYRQEWKDDTNYFLLSIPRRGWEIGLAKLATSMSFYLAVTIFTSIMILILHKNFISNQILSDIPETLSTKMIINVLLKTIMAYWFSGLFVYIIVQFSQLVSLFFDRFRGFITVIVFSLSHYLVFRGASILAPLFRWLPEIPLGTFSEVINGLPRSFSLYIGSGPIISTVLLLIAVFILGSWIFETQLEV